MEQVDEDSPAEEGGREGVEDGADTAEYRLQQWGSDSWICVWWETVAKKQDKSNNQTSRVDQRHDGVANSKFRCVLLSIVWQNILNDKTEY